jgi:serine/threonine-protein kinase HipA
MNTAFVHIWGKRVGAVAWDESTGLASFEFEESFKQNGWNLSPLKMPLNSGVNVFTFPELRKECSQMYFLTDTEIS